jgi:hypothetical protein
MKVTRLRKLREERAWPLRGVARFCAIDPKALSLAERGMGPLYPKWRQKLAQMFGVPEEALSDAEEGGE